MPEATSRDGPFRESVFQVRGRDIYEILVFAVGGEGYAVELSSVHEIVVPPPLTPVPRAPRAVVGVCGVRGRLVTVVESRTLLNLPERQGDRKARILLGRGPSDEIMGLRVDEVRHVVRLLPGELDGSIGGSVDSGELTRAIARPEGSAEIVVLDLNQLLTKGTL